MVEEQGTWVSVTETKFGVGVTNPFSCATYILSWDPSAKLTGLGSLIIVLSSTVEIFWVLPALAWLHLIGLFVAVLPFMEVRAPTDTLFLLCGELGFVAISFHLLLLLAFRGGFAIF